MNNIGHNIKITFFGESHGEFLGVVIDQIPAGIKIDFDLLDFNLSKRRPNSELSTKRVELDNYRIVSGFKNGYTTGAALTFLVPNSNKKSEDYSNLNFIPRPGHSDYPAYIKYNNFNDKSGGGMFSGRLTVLWVIVGSICQQILEQKGIFIGSHILSINNVVDKAFDKVKVDQNDIIALNNSKFPLLNKEIEKKMAELILKTKEEEDSVGGIIESAIINMPVGVGEPLFLSIESYLSQLLFAIPAIKGVAFGEGFDFASLKGSEANDEYEYVGNEVKALSNHNGGILGGLSNSMPIIIKLAVKPTSSIGKEQKSVNLVSGTDSLLKVTGRHDPQIVSRAVHVVTAVLNYAILDLLLFDKKKAWF
jgi:chorismate synthase